MRVKTEPTSVNRLSKPASVLVGLCFGVLVCLGQMSQAYAANGLPTIKELTQDAANNSFAPTSRVSLKQATAIARKHTGGRVLSANTKQRGAKVEYRVRMLVNGERVVTVTVDQSGQVRDRR